MIVEEWIENYWFRNVDYNNFIFSSPFWRRKLSEQLWQSMTTFFFFFIFPVLLYYATKKEAD